MQVLFVRDRLSVCIYCPKNFCVCILDTVNQKVSSGSDKISQVFLFNFHKSSPKVCLESGICLPLGQTMLKNQPKLPLCLGLAKAKKAFSKIAS